MVKMPWPCLASPIFLASSPHLTAHPILPPHHCLQVVLKAIQPYTRVRIPFIAQQLNVAAGDVEALLISLILDGRVKGRIDQVNQARLLACCCCCCYFFFFVGSGSAAGSLLPCVGAGQMVAGGGWSGAWRVCAVCRGSPMPSLPITASRLKSDISPHPTDILAQLLELDAELEQGPKYSALDKWAAQLQSLHAQVAAKLAV